MFKYRVIWFDDEYQTLNIIREKAFLNDIELVGFDNSKEGIEELERNIVAYDAALIDGIFFSNPDQVGIPSSDRPLLDVAMALERLATIKKLPWFILSGQSSFTKNTNRYADGLKDNQVYDKLSIHNDNLEKLWNDIKEAANKQIDTQLRLKYHRVFEVCTEEYLGIESENTLLDILKNISNSSVNINSENKLNTIRKIVEQMFTSFNKLGILPIEVSKGKGYFTNSVKFLCGLHPSYRYHRQILNPLIAFNLEYIRDISNDGSHAYGDLPLKVDAFIKNQATPYVYNAIVYQLLDILIWFKGFSDQNPDPNKNKLYTELIDKSSFVYEGILEQDEKNNYICGEYLLSYKQARTNQLGTKIRILEVIESTTPPYKYFANRFITF